MNRTTDVMRAVCAAVQANRDPLGDLDAMLGDGDHGASMAKTFAAVDAQLDGLDDAEPGTVLESVGTTILTSVGGAMGPLFGSAFVAAGEQLTEPVDGTRAAAAVAAARDSVAGLGGASVGDKTMLDALAPAAEAAEHRAADGGGVADVLAAAAAAAESGATATADMRATLGRASRLGERSIGTADPGATSVAIILRAAADSISSSTIDPPPDAGTPAKEGTS